MQNGMSNQNHQCWGKFQKNLFASGCFKPKRTYNHLGANIMCIFCSMLQTLTIRRLIQTSIDTSFQRKDHKNICRPDDTHVQDQIMCKPSSNYYLSTMNCTHNRTTILRSATCCMYSIFLVAKYNSACEYESNKNILYFLQTCFPPP
jgi:hypothetical protein